MPKPSVLKPGVAKGGSVSKDLGARLRQARERKGFTVRGLARYVGVSPSLVSQIERGRVMPSVGTLYTIANQLELVVDDLFRDAGAPRTERAKISGDARDPVQRGKNRKTIRLAEGVRWERLTPLPDSEVEFLYVVYEVGAASCDADSLIRHGGKEYAYMMSGRLGLKIGFEEFELGPGDSITFDAQMPHRLWTIGKKPAEAIWVVYNRHGDSRAKNNSE
jgi:transcriptional regulator with XRE-family HTH domain